MRVSPKLIALCGAIAMILVAIWAFRGGQESIPAVRDAEVSVSDPASAVCGAESACQAPVSSTAQPVPVGDPRLAKVAALLAENRNAEAIAILEEILKSDPTNEWASVELATQYARDAATRERAEPLLRKVLDGNSENQAALHELLTLYRGSGRANDVPEMLNKLQDGNPSSANYASAVGRVLMGEGNYQEAIPQLEKASRDSAFGASGYSLLARAYLESGNPKEAANAYEKAAAAHQQKLEEVALQGLPTDEISHDLQESQLALASALVSSNERERAREIIHAILSQSPLNREASSLLKKLENERSS